jgi:methionine--tRNA ligase beta chain
LKKLEKIRAAKEKKLAKKNTGAVPEKKPEKKAAGKEEAKGAQKEKKPKQQKQPAAAPQEAEDNLPDLSKADIRVGKIVEVWKNPKSDKCYNERIDIGGGVIREIASGLQPYVPLEEMQDALVVVIVNLKARRVAEYMSQGMVLCASNEDKSKTELLIPPEGSQPGDPVFFEGYERKPVAELPATKKVNTWLNIAPQLATDGEGRAVYVEKESGKQLAFQTERGVVRSKTIRNGGVS